MTISARAGAWYGRRVAERLFHPPRRTHHRTPADRGLAYTEDAVTTDDGVRLHLWVVPGGEDRVAVVGHGIGLTKSASLLQARLLHERGYTVVMFDHRNHALSGHDPARTDLSDRFTRDVEATVQHARRLRPDARTLVVWGFSFSTFPSFWLLSRDRCEVDAVLCDSGPADALEPLFGGFVDSGAVPLPGPLRRPAVRDALVAACAERAVAMLGADWPPPATGRFATTPMLFLASSGDTIVPADLVRRLADRYPHARTEVVRGRHLAGLKEDADAYGRHVSDFLDSVERAAEPSTVDAHPQPPA
ncbi:alpha/beta hydrolase [Cellulomonas shaoxiangyii]|uniref:Alpha/beta hydrolase n=1 Tax=Cellulomonas shaoxiangyii TaxID=2566013 RepID=A0A4P7SDX3_9CELL|nr:alpha/beta fold hydrolase [Cellulomonas shaoxiangyii]QCB92289.1 alpha/beta hydrolase [Cellulomonas shaoxiangyii]TGY85899.1 alpha/beta hydrolase [Cellulomonas shaoxiangyii]